jgi:hypothetical protein
MNLGLKTCPFFTPLAIVFVEDKKMFNGEKSRMFLIPSSRYSIKKVGYNYLTA